VPTLRRATALLLFLSLPLLAQSADLSGESHAEGAVEESKLLSHVHQLTFAGKRSGEGYFSADGQRMVFQSEREADNPFYQIYLLNLDKGEEWRVSPGVGKTTCSWLLPADKVMFASTHEDPQAAQKQKEELESRASGKKRSYSWDYDETYDIYIGGLHGEGLTNLTHEKGYDAEAAASPDGQRIVFTSNREAYLPERTDEERARLEKDPSYFADIYSMNADGSDVRRLTDAKGYDGGPFFSADGKHIVWRRFSENGETAEIYTMNADGSEQKPVTKLGAMSWAPYFHPSGDYVVFATSVQGVANFELYLVDAEGKHEPVRVTFTGGFDGLPVFSPDGARLAWTTSRAPDKTSQIFMAEWNDAAAREALGLPAKARPAAATAHATEISSDDYCKHVQVLASDDMEGRLTGTEGEKKATQYAADFFQSLGLEPAGDNGTYFQPFDFTAGVSLGEENTLEIVPASGEPTGFLTGYDWQPLAFSKLGEIGPANVVCAGYGIVAPGEEGQPEYDSYAHLDVKDKWVLVFRFLPEGVSAERRQFFNRYASLRHKTMVARDKGAVGIIVVSGPNSQVKEPLVPLKFDASLAGSSVGAVTIRDEAAGELLKAAGKELKAFQDELDKGDPVMGFEIPEVKVRAQVSIEQEKRTGRNVVARLRSNNSDAPAVLVGAHIDHLGRGIGGQSLARGTEEGDIHYGADDNASGSAGLFEIAAYLVKRQKAGDLALKRDILFASWSGEELGLLGSAHFAKVMGAEKGDEANLSHELGSYFNMDMIGRLKDRVLIHGIGSSSVWPLELERANASIGLPLVLQNDPYLPTDSTSFYVHGVPFVNAFTGVHEDYHTPRDTADKIDCVDAARISELMARLVVSAAESDTVPDYHPMEQPKERDHPGLFANGQPGREAVGRRERRPGRQGRYQGRRQHRRTGRQEDRKHLRLHLRHPGPEDRRARVDQGPARRAATGNDRHPRLTRVTSQQVLL
jgi:Tol biopolymer transport system component